MMKSRTKQRENRRVKHQEELLLTTGYKIFSGESSQITSYLPVSPGSFENYDNKTADRDRFEAWTSF